MESEFRYSVSGEMCSIPRYVEKYEIQEYIDSGKFGDVFRARHITLEEPRALKVCRNPRVDLKEFLEEARRMTKLKSYENIVRIDDFGMPSSEFPHAWYVMEFVEGKTLKKMLKDGSLNEWGFSEKARCFDEVLKAIETAWQMGVPHRDLHPGNIKLIWYLFSLAPKILDFGTQLSGATNYDTKTDGLEKTLTALNDLLQIIFQREQGFVELWRETVIKKYKAVEEIPNITGIRKCFTNVEKAFRGRNKRVQQLHDEFLQHLRMGEGVLAIPLLVELSGIRMEELSRVYSSGGSVFTTLKELYAELAKMYVTRVGGEEGLQEYYKALKPYKEGLPEALRKTLYLGETLIFKYLEDNEFSRERVSLIAIDENGTNEDKLIGYSHQQQTIKAFWTNQVKGIRFTPLSHFDLINHESMKKNRRDKVQVNEKLKEFWNDSRSASLIADICHDFDLPLELLKNHKYVTTLLNLLHEEIKHFDESYPFFKGIDRWLQKGREVSAACRKLLELRINLERLTVLLPPPNRGGSNNPFSMQLLKLLRSKTRFYEQAQSDLARLPEVELLRRVINPFSLG